MRIDALYTNGRFTTQDSERPTAGSLGVLGGRIVGLDEELHGVSADRIVDLDGAHAYPGFNDGHHHLPKHGEQLRLLDLRSPDVSSLDEAYARVAERAATAPAGEWVVGFGYDQNQLGAHPDAATLDAIAPRNPVWLLHVSIHMGVANTEAFARAGFPDRLEVPDVEGGRVERASSGDGRATGLLIERAQNLILDVIPAADGADLLENIRLGADAAVRLGITSITDPGIGTLGPIEIAAYHAARRADIPIPRVTYMPWHSTLQSAGVFAEPERWFDDSYGLLTGQGDEWVRLGPTKLFADGSLIGRSAAMYEPFADAAHDHATLQLPEEDLRAAVDAAHRYGWQIATHAIGDHAVDIVLDAYERAQRRHPREPRRHRIEHFAVTSLQQVARAARLGVIPVPQGRFLWELGDGMFDALGTERSGGCYRMRSLLDAGIVLVGSSDTPVASASPLANIESMVTRRTRGGRILAPDERVTIAQALQAYTVGAAYAVHEEHRKGTLARGMLADLVILSDDLLHVAPDHISSLAVGATIIGGEVVHDAGALRVR